MKIEPSLPGDGNECALEARFFNGVAANLEAEKVLWFPPLRKGFVVPHPVSPEQFEFPFARVQIYTFWSRFRRQRLKVFAVGLKDEGIHDGRPAVDVVARVQSSVRADSADGAAYGFLSPGGWPSDRLGHARSGVDPEMYLISPRTSGGTYTVEPQRGKLRFIFDPETREEKMERLPSELRSALLRCPLEIDALASGLGASADTLRAVVKVNSSEFHVLENNGHTYIARH